MASVFKPSYVKPVPADAVIADRADERGIFRPHVKVKDERGRALWHPLTEDRTGYLKPNDRWYARYTGIDGKTKRERGYTDREKTLRLAVEREQEAERLAADPSHQHTRRPLLEHLDDLEKTLRAKGNTPAYVALVKGRLKALFAGCKFETIADLSASRAMEWLAEQRQERLAKDGQSVKPGMSIQSRLRFIRVKRTFPAWFI